MTTETSIEFFNSFSTYDCDLPLFRQLGLEPFKAKSHTTIAVGTVEADEGTVSIKVCGLPAQFWTFVIFSKETKATTTIETGSGSLGDYWPFVEKILQGMICVEKVEKHE